MADSAIFSEDALPWTALNGKLHPSLLRGLEAMKYQLMTPVQQKVLTELPSFQADCLVQAKTGTGKTIAFLLPALHSLLSNRPLPRGQVAILVLSPTRELALQIAKECEAVTAETRPRPECHTAYGGTSKNQNLNKFQHGDPKIVIATPGRLIDYLSDRSIADKFSNLQCLVLDEADQMLEAGFLLSMTEILERLPPKSRGWQGMCFSATIPQKIEGVLAKLLRPGFTRLSTVGSDETPTVDLVTQHSLIVPHVGDIHSTLAALLQCEYRVSPQNFKVIVFGTTANGVALMYTIFSKLFAQTGGIQVFQLQSRLSQNVRTRTTEAFKEATAGIMFASDVIGRGMDFPRVSLVVQVGLPSSGEQYVHRVGRTARAGNQGRAVILLQQMESFFLHVNKKLKITPYPENLDIAAQQELENIENVLYGIDEVTKGKAYQAWLGFNKSFQKQLQLNNEGLVEQANAYAESLGCPEPPPIEKKIIGKMGLKGVRGLNIGPPRDEQGGRNRPREVNRPNLVNNASTATTKSNSHVPPQIPAQRYGDSGTSGPSGAHARKRRRGNMKPNSQPGASSDGRSEGKAMSARG